jgi:dTDP-4-dehydrorhamnose 3,5-epimerase
MPFTFRTLEIPGLILVEPRVFPDGRGVFLETFKASDFAKAGIVGPILQCNESVSARGVIRGLHYQVHPHAQGKLVRVPQGAAQDVAVDLRKGSRTFGKYVSATLSGENQLALWIPPGFAHGACALEDDTRLLYLVTGSEFRPEAERGIHPHDPTLAIRWEIAPSAQSLSDRDAALPALGAADVDFGDR